MTPSEWIEKARAGAPKLRQLLEDYHPTQSRKPIGPITAPGAEDACNVIRREIAEKKQDIDPVTAFDKALFAADVVEINTLLSEAWIGVPETTACWRIPGFKEAVELLEELPEEENDNADQTE